MLGERKFPVTKSMVAHGTPAHLWRQAMDWMDIIQTLVRTDYRKRPERTLPGAPMPTPHLIDKHGRGRVGRLVARDRKRRRGRR